jgi:hypothetical protein
MLSPIGQLALICSPRHSQCPFISNEHPSLNVKGNGSLPCPSYKVSSSQEPRLLTDIFNALTESKDLQHIISVYICPIECCVLQIMVYTIVSSFATQSVAIHTSSLWLSCHDRKSIEISSKDRRYLELGLNV